MLLVKRPSPSFRARTYGSETRLRHVVAAAVCSVAVFWGCAVAAAPAATPIKIVAFGDSLTAGLGLPANEGFVPRLQAALAAKGLAAEIANAGVSGDTAAAALARVDWSVPDGTDAVILEIGANDMLRGIRPPATRQALAAILQRLTGRHIAVLLCGMRAAPNLGGDYAAAFESIYPELAAQYGVLLYPFFLDGVAADLKLLRGRDCLAYPTESGRASGPRPQRAPIVRVACGGRSPHAAVVAIRRVWRTLLCEDLVNVLV
jgi:acyl-CoA thioesterase I